MSSSKNRPSIKCLKANIKTCWCGRRAVLKISTKDWSRGCVFYSCPNYNSSEIKETGCKFFMWCEENDDDDMGEVCSKMKREDSQFSESHLDSIKDLLKNGQDKMEAHMKAIEKKISVKLIVWTVFMLVVLKYM